MLIKTAEFAGSAKQKKDYFNHQLPEIVVVGKSNVGKSSLINALTGNGKLARVSKQPGKTRLINFFLLNRQFYLVDLPGYGFARASKTEKESWDEMMRTYFENSEQLQAAILLLDIRHKPTKEDIAMLHYIEYYAIPYVVCLTKADKIAKSKRKNEAVHKRKEIPSSFAYDILPVSSEERYGIQELLDYLERYLPKENLQEELGAGK